MSKTDEDLREAIERELEAEPGLDAAATGVAVKDGTATLSGEVSSCTERWQALKAAERVRGIRAVVDALVVRLPDDHTRSDTDIARAAALRPRVGQRGPRGGDGDGRGLFHHAAWGGGERVPARGRGAGRPSPDGGARHRQPDQGDTERARGPVLRPVRPARDGPGSTPCPPH